jgi:pimeloyl-ACP methyl ester carboxylesterase
VTLTLPGGVSRGTVTTARGPFAALTAGPADSDLPVVVLVPGWTGSKEDLAPVMPALADSGRRVVAFDQRGQYETPGTDDKSAYTLPALAADLLAVAESVSQNPVDVVGHSFGGLVVAKAVLDEPVRLNSAVLLCSGPGALPDERHPELHALATALRKIGPEATWEAMREHDRAMGLPFPPAEIEAWMRARFLHNSPVALAAKTEHLCTAPDLRVALRDRPTPVLVLTGENDDGWPVSDQTAFAHDIEAELAVLDGLGHSPAVEDPATTGEHLLAFLDRYRPVLAPIEVATGAASSEIPRVRHLIRSALGSRVSDEWLDDAELLISEVVTNAILHARPPVRVRLRLLERQLVVVVSDSGGGLPDESRTDHGRGLRIVKAVAQRCGAWVDAQGGTVWFWLPTAPSASAPTCQSRADSSAGTSGSSAAQGLTGGPISIPTAHDA